MVISNYRSVSETILYKGACMTHCNRCFFQAIEELVSRTPLEDHKLTLEKKRPAPLTGGCRIEGYVRVKKVIITIPD